jgi:hypothetical protein
VGGREEISLQVSSTASTETRDLLLAAHGTKLVTQIQQEYPSDMSLLALFS